MMRGILSHIISGRLFIGSLILIVTIIEVVIDVVNSYYLLVIVVLVF